MGSSRMFVAVEIPANVRGYLVDRLGPWQAELDGWRWGDPALWHLTLVFLGNVDDTLRPELTRRLGRAAGRHAPFEVRLGNLDAFSRPAQARILWLGVTTGREELKRLAGPVSAAARRSGIDVEDRAYRPHLTLGRRRTPIDVRDQVALGAGLRTPSWRVTSYTLVESHLGPRPQHLPVEQFELTADG